MLVPVTIAGLFNTLRTNGAIGEHRRHQPGSETYENFVQQLVTWMDKSWWASETIGELHARLARHFRRAEVRERARCFLEGLLALVERKNGWQLAED